MKKFLDRFFAGAKKKEAVSWALFDFANSSYAILMVGFVFPIFFKDVVIGGGNADFIWGLLGSIAVLLAGFLSPFIGGIADYDTRKKRKFIFFVLAAVVGTALLFFSKSGSIYFASIIFIATNLAFLLAATLYDSFLSHVSSKENAGRISGLGFGLGYLGGVIAMLAFSPFYSHGFVGEYEFIYKLTFPLVAAFLLIFSIPSFLFIPEKKVEKQRYSWWHLTKKGFHNTFETFKEFKKRKDIAWFLVAFYLMDDALVTLFVFISLYASSTVLLSINEIAYVLLAVQVVAIPASLFLGWLSDKVGQKPVLLFTLVGWIIVVILLFFIPPKDLFLGLIVALVTGLVIGGSQSVARSWFSNIVPEEKRTSLFGFNAFASKLSAVLGPLIFGAVSTLTGSQRWGMLSLLPFFILSFIIFATIKVGAKPEEKIEDGNKEGKEIVDEIKKIE